MVYSERNSVQIMPIKMGSDLTYHREKIWFSLKKFRAILDDKIKKFRAILLVRLGSPANIGGDFD